MFKDRMTVGKIPNLEIYISLLKYAKSKGIKTSKDTETGWKDSYKMGFKNIAFDASTNTLCGNSSYLGDSTNKMWITIDEFIDHCNSFKQSKLELTSDYTANIDFSTEVVNVGCQKIPFKKVEELYNLIKK